jgi:hypothetical protein
MGTPLKAPKVEALRQRPDVAVTHRRPDMALQSSADPRYPETEVQLNIETLKEFVIQHSR